MPPGEAIEGYDELMKRLERVKSLKPITSALKLGAAHIMGFLQWYPAQYIGRKQPFKTEKQRRYFFWALKQGRIEVPYRRGQSPGSRNLKQQWRTVVESPVRVVVENPAPYARLVQGQKTQTKFHKITGWPTDVQAVRKARPVLDRAMKSAIDKVLSGDSGG